MRVRTIPEALSEPYLESRKLFRTFDKVKGLDCSVTVPLTPFKLSASEARADTPPPTLGAHTTEVLQSIGYTAAQIDELHAKKII